MGIVIGKGKAFLNVQVANGSHNFMELVARIKSLPKDKYAWNSIAKTWEVAYDQYWNLLELFKDENVVYAFPKERLEGMFEKVFIHFHREFKHQIGITSIKHRVPDELIRDKHRVITPEQIKGITDWCIQHGVEYHVEPAVLEYLEHFENTRETEFECSLFKGKLYPFQKDGALFLLERKRAILADMTGLGKCPQSLAVIARLFERGEVNKALVFCPNTIKKQWETETVKFTTLNPMVISGGRSQRQMQYRQAMQNDVHIVIANYDLLLPSRDLVELKMLRAGVIIADEVSIIKNPNAQKTKAINELVASYKYALSATPLENNPGELFTICSWVDPEILGDWWKFYHKHAVKDYWGGISHYKDLEVISKKLKGVMIRRKKEEVLEQLPKVVPQVRRIELDRTTRYVYNKICGLLTDTLNEADSLLRKKSDDDKQSVREYNSAKGNAMVLFSLLKQVCDDARMLETSKSEMAEELVQTFDMAKTKSNKLDEIENVVQEIIRNNQKVVIFSEFTRMIDLLRGRLCPYSNIVEIHGKIPQEQRHENRVKFWEDNSVNILLSSDAGKYGQNLQVASYLINVDLPWNPAILEQRIGRIYRLGSEHQNITVINFITVDTVEERIYEILNDKLQIFEQVIEGKQFEDVKLNPSTMRKLISSDFSAKY